MIARMNSDPRENNNNNNNNYSKLPSKRNQDWEKVKVETENLNKLLENIPTDNITELNGLIYAGSKLDSVKIGIPQGTRTEIQNLDGK